MLVMRSYREICRDWLIAMIEKRGRGARTGLAAHMGIRLDAISRMTNTDPRKETREISANELMQMSEFFGEAPPVPVRGAPREVPVAKRPREVPLIDLVAAGNWREATDPYPIGAAEEVVWTDQPVSEAAFALRITGASMEDRFTEGDVIIVDPAVEPGPGDFVVAKREIENEATFKKFRPRTVGGSFPVFDLVPLNEDYPTITASKADPVQIVGTMVEHRKYRRRR